MQSTSTPICERVSSNTCCTCLSMKPEASFFRKLFCLAVSPEVGHTASCTFWDWMEVGVSVQKPEGEAGKELNVDNWTTGAAKLGIELGLFKQVLCIITSVCCWLISIENLEHGGLVCYIFWPEERHPLLLHMDQVSSCNTLVADMPTSMQLGPLMVVPISDWSSEKRGVSANPTCPARSKTLCLLLCSDNL